MTLELNFYLRVDSMVNIYASFLLYFSCCTSFWSLMLVPLPFWESILPPNLNNKHFCLLPIKDDRPTNRFILLQFGCNSLRINANTLRCILLQFKVKLIAFFLVMISCHMINIVIKCLLSMIAQSGYVFYLLLGQIQDEFTEDLLHYLSLSSLHSNTYSKCCPYQLQSIINGRKFRNRQTSTTQARIRTRSQQIRCEKAEDQAQWRTRDRGHCYWSRCVYECCS